MRQIKQLIKKYYKHCLIAIVVLSLIISGIIVNADSSTNINNNNNNYDYLNYNKITVCINGEVNYPGKYVLDSNSNIKDLINAANGLTNNAETAYINLNKILVNDEVIYIPTKEINNINRININVASLEQLMELSGIGAEKASSIIVYRTINGSFNTLEDLLNVPGITNSVLLNIKNEIKLS